jgi:hypothetical protein
MLFLPFSLLFGWVAVENGINWSGFMLAGAAVVLAVLLVISVHASRGVTPMHVAVTAKQEAVEVTQAAEQLACKQLVELVADYLDDALSPEIRARSRDISPAATAARPISSKPNRSSASSAVSRPNATMSRLRGGKLPITDQIPSGPLPRLTGIWAASSPTERGVGSAARPLDEHHRYAAAPRRSP